MTSTPRSYFDKVYSGTLDPWDFSSSPYEQRKYALTMASLPRPHYYSAYEPGCSVGVLSELLSERCARLLSTDIVPAVVEHASRRLSPRRHVRVEKRAIPEQWPEGDFDLIVLSEIAYYFDDHDLRRIMSRVLESTNIGAHIVGVHWRGPTNYPLSAEAAHEVIESTSGLSTVVLHSEA